MKMYFLLQTRTIKNLSLCLQIYSVKIASRTKRFDCRPSISHIKSNCCEHSRNQSSLWGASFANPGGNSGDAYNYPMLKSFNLGLTITF